jgi:transcriptional regulator with XRE-family HTH domain
VFVPARDRNFRLHVRIRPSSGVTAGIAPRQRWENTMSVSPLPAPSVAEGAEKPAHPPLRANTVDRHVGARIRERRLMLGLSQQQLAEAIGVTYQQAHKYERGLNRISAGRLYGIAQVLGVPVSWFFDGIGTGGEAVQLTQRQRLCLEVARNFAQISNERHQAALSQMARVLAEAQRETK